MSIEGITSYADIYSESLTDRDMQYLDDLGVEWRGRNVLEVRDEVCIKIMAIFSKVYQETALTNPAALPQLKAEMIQYFEGLFVASPDEDEPSPLVYRFDPISGTYRELIVAEGFFKKLAQVLIPISNKKARKQAAEVYTEITKPITRVEAKAAEWVEEHPVAATVIAVAVVVTLVATLGPASGPINEAIVETVATAGASAAAAAAAPSSNGRKRDESNKNPTPSTGSSPPPSPSSPTPLATTYNFNPLPSFLSTSSPNSTRAEGLIPPISTLSNTQNDFSPPIYQSTMPVDRNIPVTLPLPPNTFTPITPNVVNKGTALTIPPNIPSSGPLNTFTQITPTFINQGPIPPNVPISIISPPYQSPFQTPLPNSALSPNWKLPTPPSNDFQTPAPTTPPSALASLVDRLKNLYQSTRPPPELFPSFLPSPFLSLLPSIVPNFLIHLVCMEPPPPKTFEIPGKKLARGAIGGINGIANNLEQAKANANYLAQMSHGYQINWVYNKTNSFIVDIVETALFNFKGISAPAKTLLEEWMKFHEEYKNDPMAKFLQPCHSQGAIHVKIALENAPQEIRDRIIVVAIAPAAIIPKELCFDSFNYASKGDPIPCAEAAFNYDADAPYEERIAESSREALKELILLEPHPDDKGFGHNFDSLTFRPVISQHFEEHVKKYGEPQ